MTVRAVHPDVADFYFCSRGEFSPYSDEAFEKHLQQLYNLVHRLKRSENFGTVFGLWYKENSVFNNKR